MHSLYYCIVQSAAFACYSALMRHAFLNLCFPQICLGCYRLAIHNGVLCKTCNNRLARIPKYQQYKRNIPCHGVFEYDTLMATLVQRMKFQRQLQCCDFLANALADAIQQHYTTLPTLLLPIPLHTKRLRNRGFNQVVEIAKGIRRRLKIPIDTRSLVREKNTKPQSLSRQNERQANLHNAFRCVKPLSTKHVILLDDVITTGCTVTAALKSLAIQPAVTIDVWCCAIT